MRTAQDIVFGVTSQTVWYDAPEGRPSSVTSVEVFPWDMPDDQADTTAIGSGSVETNPNTTIDADSGYGQTDARKANVAATTGMAVGRTYLLTSADGAKEWAEVLEIDSGNYFYAKHPLHNAYTTADTCQSTRIQATIDSTWVADETNIRADAGGNPHYRVRWVYVVSGVTYVADTYFNLVRYASRHGVLPQDMESFLPGWLDHLPTDHRADQGRRLIDDAYREVRVDLHQVDLAASSIAESEVVDELVRHKSVEMGEWARFLSGATSDESRATAATKRYTARLDSLIRIVSRVPVRDETGAATPIIAQGLSRR
jgi:hypothetical protein